MTEYIITEEQLEIIEYKATNDYEECAIPEEILLAIRSRPYNPQAEITVDEVIQHKKYAADAERKKVLDELEKWIPGQAISYDYGYYEPSVDVFALNKKIKEIRKGGE